LNSWQPRRPSAGLKRRIFAGASQSSSLATRWLLGALTPTMACALLTLMLLNSGNGFMRQKTGLTMDFSNQTYAFGNDNGGPGGQNRLGRVTFDWTNHSGFNSSMRFTPTTNSSN
jgi:hypothetical protein